MYQMNSNGKFEEVPDQQPKKVLNEPTITVSFEVKPNLAEVKPPEEVQPKNPYSAGIILAGATIGIVGGLLLYKTLNIIRSPLRQPQSKSALEEPMYRYENDYYQDFMIRDQKDYERMKKNLELEFEDANNQPRPKDMSEDFLKRLKDMEDKDLPTLNDIEKKELGSKDDGIVYLRVKQEEEIQQELDDYIENIKIKQIPRIEIQSYQKKNTESGLEFEAEGEMRFGRENEKPDLEGGLDYSNFRKKGTLQTTTGNPITNLYKKMLIKFCPPVRLIHKIREKQRKGDRK